MSRLKVFDRTLEFVVGTHKELLQTVESRNRILLLKIQTFSTVYNFVSVLA